MEVDRWVNDLVVNAKEGHLRQFTTDQARIVNARKTSQT